MNGWLRPRQKIATLEREPLDRVGMPELVVERGDVAVAGEQVVVVALEQHPVADVERRHLAAEAGPALVDVALVSAAREPVRGRRGR